MTHPLTPREKVAQMAAEAFHNGYQSYDECDETMRMRFDWIADMIVGSPALASGSGDHAELARLAEAASGSEWQTYISGRPEYRNVTHYVEQNPPRDLPFIAEVQEERDAAFIAAANPATVLALLAENAALRASIGRHDRQVSGMLRARLAAENRATEAERKLAEAVGLNDRAADLMRQCTDPERFEGASTLNVYANMRAWLSSLPPAPGAGAEA